MSSILTFFLNPYYCSSSSSSIHFFPQSHPLASSIFFFFFFFLCSLLLYVASVLRNPFSNLKKKKSMSSSQSPKANGTSFNSPPLASPIPFQHLLLLRSGNFSSRYYIFQSLLHLHNSISLHFPLT
ncbi:hypothetical protein ES332_A13G049500v1 [Gossypium tomentosum]|uniref:Uncharacterized protein n=1 Tax=Gossypium tomentosum TaxID=34277 RepID=A0A5D2MGB3_GOSTO|nr:hypothetical protein ES332_A13G049500v1 [Gossypium tomentosum]